MKKISSVLLILIAISFQLKAIDNQEYFNLNEEDINAQFKELNAMESVVLQNANNPFYLNTLNSQNALVPLSGLNIATQSSTILPPFIWGCLGGPVGMLVVYVLSDNDSQAMMRSFWGCLVGSCLWGSYGATYYGPY